MALVARGLNRGKHIFVEQPLFLEISEGQELMRRAKEKGLMLMVELSYTTTRR
ncbi:hypothetical protein DFAR_1910001 [Desulfarculales bacterium]